jgi:hypothetical protein
MVPLLDNLPIFYTIGRRGNPNLLVTIMTKNLEGSSIELASSIVIDTDLGLAKRRLMDLKKTDPSNRDCVIFRALVYNSGEIVYDPESPEEVDRSQPSQNVFTGFCSQSLLDPDKVEEAWKSVPEYTPLKRDPIELPENKPGFFEKIKKILF